MKIMITTLSAGLLVLASAAAFAGETVSVPVEVVVNPDGSGRASGDMVSARTSTSDLELIGCGIKAIKGEPRFAFCQAADRNDNFAICTTSKSELYDAIKAISPYSYILFEFDSNGDCTRIDLSTQSFYLPSNVTGN